MWTSFKHSGCSCAPKLPLFLVYILNPSHYVRHDGSELLLDPRMEKENILLSWGQTFPLDVGKAHHTLGVHPRRQWIGSSSHASGAKRAEPLLCFGGQAAMESLSTWRPDVHSSWGTAAEPSVAQAVCHHLDFEEGQEGMLLQPGLTCQDIHKHRHHPDLTISPFPKANSGQAGNPPKQILTCCFPVLGVTL